MPKKILVIDDEPDLREIVEEILASAGYQVITAADGQEGVDKAFASNPDLILLDIAMPQMDGFEVLSTLRGRRETATIPVIMLTAKGRTDNILEAERLRAVDFLIKPFKAKEILKAVQKNVR